MIRLLDGSLIETDTMELLNHYLRADFIDKLETMTSNGLIVTLHNIYLWNLYQEILPNGSIQYSYKFVERNPK